MQRTKQISHTMRAQSASALQIKPTSVIACGLIKAKNTPCYLTAYMFDPFRLMKYVQSQTYGDIPIDQNQITKSNFSLKPTLVIWLKSMWLFIVWLQSAHT